MEMMTLKKAAEYLGINPEVLRRKAADGSIPAKKLGKKGNSHWRFFKEELDKLLHWENSIISSEKEQYILVKELLQEYYNSEDEETDVAILNKMGDLGSTEVVPYLCEVLLNSETPPAVVVQAMKSLVQLLEDKARIYLVKLAGHENEWIRIEVALFYVKYFQDESAIAYLKEYYQRTKSFVVLKSLLQIEPEKYQNELKKMLQDKYNLHDRLLALRIMRSLEIKEYLKFIKPLFEDNDLKIKMQLIELSGEKKLKQLVPQLQEIISSKLPDNFKKAAAKAISEIYS